MASLDLDDVLAQFAAHTCHLFDATSVELSWLDRGNDQLVMLVEWVEGSHAVTSRDGTVYDLKSYPATQYVLDGGEPVQVRVADPEADPAERRLLESQGLRSLLMVPLMYQDVAIGLIEVVDVHDRTFTAAEVRLCRDFSRIAASAVHNAMTYARAHESSTRDAATGLYNRRIFDDHLEQTLAQAGQADDVAALLMVDLDRLKHINDTRGHEAGDKALRVVVETLRECVRSCDTPCRIGGDEFAVILPGGAREAAYAIARGIHMTLARRGSTVAASIGLAVYPVDAQSAHELSRAADIASYRAKAAGGARTETVPQAQQTAA